MKTADREKDSFFTPLVHRLETWFSTWLLHEEKRHSPSLQNFDAMCEELHPADVLLFRGRARISRAIRVISQSQWTHAALYIGRASEIPQHSKTSALIQQHFHGDPEEQLLIESLLGQGLVVTPLANYAHESIRLCRPRGLLGADAKIVVQHALQQMGTDYDLRQLIDLARFIFPYTIMPRRWHSTLFNYKVGAATRTVCSTVLAEAFMAVKFPVIPVIHQNNESLSVVKRNPRLITPRDFDYSPYFNIIKFPYVSYDQSFLGIHTKGGYRELPWAAEDAYCNNHNDCIMPKPEDAKSPQEGQP